MIRGSGIQHETETRTVSKQRARSRKGEKDSLTKSNMPDVPVR